MIVSHHITKALANERIAELQRERAAHKRHLETYAAAGSEARADRNNGSGSGEEVVRFVSSASVGDQGGWATLVRRFGGLLSSIARAHRLRDADAADVTQATWLRLIEHLDSLNDPACVGAWLATTARHECLRVLRDAPRQLPYGEDVPEMEWLEPLPGDELLIAERDEALWRGFARLRPSDRALLLLLMAEPRPAYEEIAALLEMPVGSIGPTRARALERLRTELENDGALTLLTT